MVTVTGATGLLGTHLIARFQQAGIPLTALVRNENQSVPIGVVKKTGDILDPVALNEAFKGADTVIHSAAFVSFNPRRYKTIMDINVRGTERVVDACLQQGVKNLIHVSSVAALGRKPGELTNEQSAWTGEYASDYAESKYLAELEVFRGGEEGLNVSMVNPSVILSATHTSRSSAALFDYVWREKKFFTGGLLNYVDARDVAEVIFRLHEKPMSGEKFILSAGALPFEDFFSHVATRMKKRKPSIKISSTLAWWAGWAEETISLFLNREPLVTRLSARLGQQSFQYDSRKANEVLGIQFRSFEETLTWCCEEFVRNVNANK